MIGFYFLISRICGFMNQILMLGVMILYRNLFRKAKRNSVWLWPKMEICRAEIV